MNHLSIVAAVLVLVAVAVALATRRHGAARRPEPSAAPHLFCERCGVELDPAVDFEISDDGEFLHRACAIALGHDVRRSEDGAEPDCSVCGQPIESKDDWVWTEAAGRRRSHASCAELEGE